jgi:hypothetical protein
MDKEEEFNLIIDGLIKVGAIEIEGIDSETGEFLYRITDKMNDINPKIYNAHLNDIYENTMYFWEKGFVDIDDITSNNPIVTLAPKAFNQNDINQLPSDRIETLRSMIRAMNPDLEK